jgi:hypothetical protein
MKNPASILRTAFTRSVTTALCSLLFLHWYSDAFGSELQPFSSYIKDRPEWYKDDSEVAYVSTRCGVLLTAIGGIFQNDINSETSKKTGLEIVSRGTYLLELGRVMSEKIGGIKNFEYRGQLLFKTYGEAIRANRALHNNMLHGFIHSDFEFCSRFHNNVSTNAK